MHDPKHIPIPLELARSLVAYLGSRPYTEVVALLGALDGVVVEWQRHERERAAGEPSPAPTGRGSANIDELTGSGSPSAAPVDTDGDSRPMSNGRNDA